ncbi:HYExAFE family protein [Gemmata sp.]|uniref:HYExAFE family protein n=1 Tax=Gemmata sp. TaxID=1914242 RepID=UPI003F709106
MNRDNHYEAAFEAYLRSRGVAVVAVDEARRSYLDDESIKSPDFLVVGPHDARLVVDVKGRRFPGGTAEHPRMVWQNWVEREDVTALERWAVRFGPGFRGVLAFTYHVLPCVELPEVTPDVFRFRDQVYLMRGVCAGAYRAAMKQRSPRWGTVHVPTAAFRELVKPFTHFLRPAGVEFREFTAENAEIAES